MIELNKDILEQSIQKLPAYEPPTAVWNGIEQGLVLRELPTYEPPAMVWDSIENELYSAEKYSKKLSILRGRLRYYGLAAASLALIFSVAIYAYFNSSDADEVSMAISTEIVDNQIFIKNEDEVNRDKMILEQLCKTALPKCENPEFLNLKQELEELDNAYYQLKTNLENYNTDSDLVIQLSKIENERSAVLRQMIAFL